MKTLILVTSMLVASLAFANDKEVRKFFEKNCNTCHGEKSVDMHSPILYGQDKGYILKQLADFRSGVRNDNIMHGEMNAIASALTEAEMEKIATYLNQLSPCDYPPKDYDLPGNVEAGKVLSQTCKQCHHTWFPGIKVPTLYGQKPLYIYRTLNAFKFQRRGNSEQMAHQATTLNDAQIRDISSYFGQRLECTIHEKF